MHFLHLGYDSGLVPFSMLVSNKVTVNLTRVYLTINQHFVAENELRQTLRYVVPVQGKAGTRTESLCTFLLFCFTCGYLWLVQCTSDKNFQGAL